MPSRPPCASSCLDDEEAVLLPTARYFRSLGCTVDVAAEPEEAEALVSHRRYDLAILDLRVTRFGGTEGLEVLREIRRRDHAHQGHHAERLHLAGGGDGSADSRGRAPCSRKPQPLPDLAHLAFALTGVARG